jgi:hypothetical protein
MYIYIYIYMCVCMCACVRAWVCYVNMCVCMHVYMNMCIHSCVHIFRHTHGCLLSLPILPSRFDKPGTSIVICRHCANIRHIQVCGSRPKYRHARRDIPTERTEWNGTNETKGRMGGTERIKRKSASKLMAAILFQFAPI